MRVHVLQFVEKCIRKIRDILLGRFAFRCSSLGLLQTPVPFLEECRLHRKVRAPEMVGNCESVGKKIAEKFIYVGLEGDLRKKMHFSRILLGCFFRILA